MSLIVNPSGTINWSLTREQLAYKSLQKIGRLGAGETPAAEDMQIVTDALEAVLKNLPVHGYKWPKTISGSYAANFAIGVQTATLPADFYNLVSLSYIDASGNEQFLFPATTMEWNRIVNKTNSGTNTTGSPFTVYIDNFNVLHLWPKQQQATVINVYYQQVMLDTVPGTNIDLDSPWMLAIPYGVGVEVAYEFDIPAQKLAGIQAKWVYERDLLIQHEAANSVNQVSVDD